ncbi:MAG: hypothetical protein IKO61_01075 [Lachnospiraceae bacterium]|nr:hypothetical protein [Lachnospiraceae bacterium]
MRILLRFISGAVQEPQKSGEKAGTQGYAYKLEAFQVNFVRKGETFKLASQNKKAKSFYDKTRDGANPEEE